MIGKSINPAMQRKRFTLTDVFIIIAIAAAAVTLMTLNVYRRTDEEMIAVVRQNSEELFSVNLSRLTEPYEYCIEGEFHIKLEFGCDFVRIISSDCEDQICVNTGELNKIGQSAVCLPARVSVEIKGGGRMSALDGVTG